MESRQVLVDVPTAAPANGVGKVGTLITSSGGPLQKPTEAAQPSLWELLFMPLYGRSKRGNVEDCGG